MEKPILSRFDLNTDCFKIKEFRNIISDIIELDEYQKLKDCYQHLLYTRFQHSINVAYYSYLIAKKFKLDYVSATRAGIVHDFYLYDWKKNEQPIDGRHSVVHAKVALENAKKYIDVNDTMEDAILNHMWPMCISKPKSKEGWVVQAADKFCATLEFTSQTSRKLKTSMFAIYLLFIVSYIL